MTMQIKGRLYFCLELYQQLKDLRRAHHKQVSLVVFES